MARLVAKEYANWERTNAEFPYLRTFDVWRGIHGRAARGSGSGNNQESSSEAVQGWGGVFLLGAALNDDAMTAAGAMATRWNRRRARILVRLPRTQRRVGGGDVLPKLRARGHGDSRWRRAGVRDVLQRRSGVDLRHPMAAGLAVHELPRPGP